jgi:RNA polymerase sigma-70 factor (ECF subfamily)
MIASASMTTERPVGEATDAELARAIADRPGAAGAEEAELYRRFAPRVRLYGLRHLGDEALAQDLVQQVLLVTIEKLRAGDVRETGAIASFILGTSRLTAGNLRRTTRRHRDRLAPVEAAVAAGVPPAPFDLAPDVARLERCLHQLGERDRSVLILTFYGERSSAEIGRDLGLAEGAIRVCRHRALARLRECVGTGRTV